jgi:ATP-dependent Lon protease
MDVEDLPKDVFDSIKFIYAETVDDVIKAALDQIHPKIADQIESVNPDDGKTRTG